MSKASAQLVVLYLISADKNMISCLLFKMLRLLRGSVVLNSCMSEYVEGAEHMVIK